MKPTPQERLILSFAAVSNLSAILTFMAGCIGIFINTPFVRSAIPGLVTMKVNTAVCFILAGLSLWLIQISRNTGTNRLIALCCISLIAVIAGLTFFEYISGIDIGIDQLLIHVNISSDFTVNPARMALSTVISFFLACYAMFLIISKEGRGHYLYQVPAIFGMLIASVVLLGYLYNVPLLYHFPRGNPVMAFHTSIVFFIMFPGVIFARPDTGPISIVTRYSAGGFVARSLTPIAIIVPPIFGMTKLLAEKRGVINNEFGISLVATANAAVISAFIIWFAALIDKTELKHKNLRDKQERESLFFTTIFDNTPNAVYIYDMTGKFIEANPAACNLLGYEHEVLLKMSASNVESSINTALISDRIAQVKKDGRITSDVIYNKGDGTIVSLEVDSQVVDLRGEKVIMNIVHDITLRRRIEEALKIKIREMEIINKTTVDRELKMVELKKKIKDLEGEIEKERRHE